MNLKRILILVVVLLLVAIGGAACSIAIDGVSLTGPQEGWGTGDCAGSWDAWHQNAGQWFTSMGYPTFQFKWPSTDFLEPYVKMPSMVMFYEIAHSDTCSHYFKNDCINKVTGADLHTWLEYTPQKSFGFFASCQAMCGTGEGTLSYEYRKGSNTDTATVGYCGMGFSSCNTCWTYSLVWQDRLFYYMSLGYTVKAAFDMALDDYPFCEECVRFAGDENHRVQ